MNTAIFIFYLIFFCLLVYTIPFLKNSGIGEKTLVALFLTKIVAGFAYAKFYTLPKNYAGSDTWRFFRLSLDETRLLSTRPLYFIKDLFSYGYASSGNLFSGKDSYWNNLKSNLIIKMMAVMNLVTNNNYYTNIILFNFLFLFGLVALFKCFYKQFPEKKYSIIAGVFLLPSTLFWCSGIHKDGLILSATGLIVYCFYPIPEDGFSFKKAIVIFLCFCLVFALRNYVAFALLPGLYAWWICKRTPAKKAVVFTGIYLVGITLFFLLPLVFPAINLPLFLVNKQQEFLLLKGESEVNVPKLIPDIFSFVRFFPTAVDMGFFRPHITEIKHISYIPAIAEIIILWAILVFYILFQNHDETADPIIWFMIFFAVSVLLVAGYTIPFTGAIVRYRSFVLPFLVTPLLCLTNTNISKRKNHAKNIDS